MKKEVYRFNFKVKKIFLLPIIILLSFILGLITEFILHRLDSVILNDEFAKFSLMIMVGLSAYSILNWLLNKQYMYE